MMTCCLFFIADYQMHGDYQSFGACFIFSYSLLIKIMKTKTVCCWNHPQPFEMVIGFQEKIVFILSLTKKFWKSNSKKLPSLRTALEFFFTIHCIQSKNQIEYEITAYCCWGQKGVLDEYKLLSVPQARQHGKR